MEPYEKLKSLSNEEKIKCFEVLVESIKLASDGSDDPENPQKESLFSLFNNLTGGNNSSSEGSPTKRQKTLDSWLIKSKDLSPRKSKSGESSRTLNSWLVKPKESSSNEDKAGGSCTVERSTSKRLSSDATESSDSTKSIQNNLDGCNSSSSSKNIKQNSSKSEKHSLSKFDTVNSSPVKNVQISPIKICNSAVIDSKSYSLRPKRKRKFRNTSPDQSPAEADAENTGQTKFNEEIIQPEAPNNIDVNQGILSPNIHLGLSCENVFTEAGDSLNSNSYNTRNRRSQKSNSNLQNSTLSSRSIKRNKVTELEDLNVSDKTPLEKKKLQKAAHSLSSSQSDWEAFHILESACARMNLNVSDILENEHVQNILNDPEKLDNDTVFLINSFQSNEKILPVVHLIESRKKLPEMLKKTQKPV